MPTKKSIRKHAKKAAAYRRKATPESGVSGQIVDYLNAHGIRSVRNDVVRGRIVGGGYIDTQHPRGTADRTAYVPYRVKHEVTGLWVTLPGAFRILHIETKAPRGKQSPEQVVWQSLVESYGEHYIVAKSYEPIEAWLREKGVLR